MKLLELKYIMTSARNVAAVAKGMVELKSIVFNLREERGRWRQGPRCLRCSKLRRIAAKVKWMGRVYPRVDFT